MRKKNAYVFPEKETTHIIALLHNKSVQLQISSIKI